ncbi:MAG: hypothetical protein WCA07_17285 [Gloeobacterales cyanobacterium]
MAQQIFIDGIGISSYRSFGSEIQRIGPLEKINLFIGQNNSGKSNILLFLHKHYKNAVEEEATPSNQNSTLRNTMLKFEGLDKHLGQNFGEMNIAIGLKIEGEKYAFLLYNRFSTFKAYLERILKSKTLTKGKNIAWFLYKTSDQYSGTHSAHLLDTPGAAIFHVRHSEGVSKVESVYTSSEKSHICADLGYRASDLLQANYIVWVEGPSDRVYINYWISAIDPELIEGLHYSIMFYGGRLLSHLSAEEKDFKEQEINKFIDLRSLNRNISIVIDSDREQEDSSINGTKQRIVEEFNTGAGFAWVTKGREIENYVGPNSLEVKCSPLSRQKNIKVKTDNCTDKRQAK